LSYKIEKFGEKKLFENFSFDFQRGLGIELLVKRNRKIDLLGLTQTIPTDSGKVVTG
jgi:ATP-binding cassette subfamily F protein uup